MALLPWQLFWSVPGGWIDSWREHSQAGLVKEHVEAGMGFPWERMELGQKGSLRPAIPALPLINTGLEEPKNSGNLRKAYLPRIGIIS